MRRRTPSKAEEEAFVSGAESESERGGLSVSLEALRPAEKPEQEGVVAFNLRLPKSLHADLQAVSEATGRSMHEICMHFLEPAIRAARREFAPEG